MPDPNLSLPVRVEKRGDSFVVVDANGKRVPGSRAFTSEQSALVEAKQVNAAWARAKAERRAKGAPEITQEAFVEGEHPRGRAGQWVKKGIGALKPGDVFRHGGREFVFTSHHPKTGEAKGRAKGEKISETLKGVTHVEHLEGLTKIGSLKSGERFHDRRGHEWQVEKHTTSHPDQGAFPIVRAKRLTSDEHTAKNYDAGKVGDSFLFGVGTQVFPKSKGKASPGTGRPRPTGGEDPIYAQHGPRFHVKVDGEHVGTALDPIGAQRVAGQHIQAFKPKGASVEIHDRRHGKTQRFKHDGKYMRLQEARNPDDIVRDRIGRFARTRFGLASLPKQRGGRGKASGATSSYPGGKPPTILDRGTRVQHKGGLYTGWGKGTKGVVTGYAGGGYHRVRWEGHARAELAGVEQLKVLGKPSPVSPYRLRKEQERLRGEAERAAPGAKGGVVARLRAIEKRMAIDPDVGRVTRQRLARGPASPETGHEVKVKKGLTGEHWEVHVGGEHVGKVSKQVTRWSMQRVTSTQYHAHHQGAKIGSFSKRQEAVDAVVSAEREKRGLGADPAMLARQEIQKKIDYERETRTINVAAEKRHHKNMMSAVPESRDFHKTQRDAAAARVQASDAKIASLQSQLKGKASPSTGRGKVTFKAELYRSPEGHEVWRIRDSNGVVAADNIASDHDLKAIMAEYEGAGYIPPHKYPSKVFGLDHPDSHGPGSESGPRGKASLPTGSEEAYQKMKATAGALGLPWDDAEMRKQMGIGAPAGEGPADPDSSLPGAKPKLHEQIRPKGTVSGLDVEKGLHTPDVGGVSTVTASQFGSIEGKGVVVTGKLSTGTRDEIHQSIGYAGGKPQSAVTAKTSLLVVGDKPGSKLKKALELGIPVMTEQEFYNLIHALREVEVKRRELRIEETERKLEEALAAGRGSEAAVLRARLGGLTESTLTTKERKKLPKGAFAIPEKAPDSGSYPIHDEAHARSALSRVAQHGSPAEQARVRAAVKRRYPHIGKAA